MAADELFNMRPEFVKKVSEATIKQLVDDLLKDRVLHDGEKDSIIRRFETKADNARALVDAVRSKGDDASSKMIAHLEKTDPKLYSELRRLCSQPPQPPQPAAQVKMQTEWSDTLLPATDAFWNEKQKDSNTYRVSKESIRNRVALLITNITFKDPDLNRDGAEQDEKNMEKLLSGLGYEVKKETDLTAEEIENALIKFSRDEKLKKTDSVVVVMMSHGKPGAVCGVNYKEEESEDVKKEPADLFPIDKIFTHLGSKNCPALVNKPKIIIIQACSGDQDGAVEIVIDGASQVLVCGDASQPGAEGRIKADASRRVHREKDFFALRSSTPGTVSYRDEFSGSVLIQYIVEVFYTHAKEDHIDELFTKVIGRVADDRRIMQVPIKDRTSAIKHFYFFPGH